MFIPYFQGERRISVALPADSLSITPTVCISSAAESIGGRNNTLGTPRYIHVAISKLEEFDLPLMLSEYF